MKNKKAELIVLHKVDLNYYHLLLSHCLVPIFVQEKCLLRSRDAKSGAWNKTYYNCLFNGISKKVV